MANDIALFEQGGDIAVPDYLKGVSATTTALTGGSTGGNAKRISIKGSVFRMVVGDKEIAKNEERSMNMVIVGSAPAFARTYYAGEYKEGVITLPACWSDDGNAPSANCESPQASLCANCPQNVKGSGQGNSRACRYSARLAVVLENDVEGSMYGMSIPATSLFGKESVDGMLSLQSYAQFLAQNGYSVDRVVTQFKFDTNSAVPKLLFKAVRPLTEQEFATVTTLAEGSEIDTHIGDRSFSSGDGTPAGAAPAPQEVKNDAIFEQPTPEPVKAEKKAAPAVAEDDMSGLLDEWGDDD